MDQQSRDDDMLFDLACSILHGDLVKARETLDLMVFVHSKGHLVMAALRRVSPPIASIGPSAPLVLPIPGHGPGSFGLESHRAPSAQRAGKQRA